MNLVLIPKQVECLKWDAADPRTHHLLNVLKVEVGSEVDFAVENGPRGKGTVTSLEKGGVELSMAWNDSHASNFLPVHLLVGLSRPKLVGKSSNKPHPWVWRSFISFMPKKENPHMVRVPCGKRMNGRIGLKMEWSRHSRVIFRLVESTRI